MEIGDLVYCYENGYMNSGLGGKFCTLGKYYEIIHVKNMLIPQYTEFMIIDDTGSQHTFYEDELRWFTKTTKSKIKKYVKKHLF